MRKLEGLRPERVFFYFEEISKIPRESYREKQISDFLMDFGKKHNLQAYQDKALNVVLRKKPSPGYENAPGVILQGHMDMVCEKEEGSLHDFTKDAIKLVVNGNYLTADKTTLGADNGIAVAMGLAILESDTIEHPPLEVLFTTSEEVDLGGAAALEKGILKGKRLINIDSEKEGIITVGCAGGENIVINLSVKNVSSPFEFAYKLKIQNLLGGHSGMEIHRKRANANKLMAKLLEALKQKAKIELAAVQGGSKDNAIPRTAEAVITSGAPIDGIIEETLKSIKAEYRSSEPQMEILFEKTPKPAEVFSEKTFENYIGLIKELPTGVYSRMKEYPDIVETSDNLAIVNTENEKTLITLSMRSCEPEGLKRLKEKTADAAKKYGASYEFSAYYPAWKYRPNSLLREKAVDVWKKLTGREMQVAVIHAGLECGAILENYPDLECISIGPNMSGVHTPEEKLEIASAEKVYNYIVELLKELK